ncbi:ABC transporter ATP-binding protein [Radicibacter daui]|uniref:ABC transporter ATP-binding protein n=1 Tax=Radicibacter daui TaxID=3064829 RepID=UPI004046F9C1
MADVTLRKVRKAFGDLEIIRGVDLEVKDREFVVFVGPSGCGKSTLLRLIAGLEDITSGELWIDGELVNDLPPAKRGIAMVFQSYALYPHMTVYENMAFGLRLAKMPQAEIEQRVKKAAQILQMDHLLQRKPAEMSGGQRQRVAIGRAIVRDPKVFLFDEPLSNLDAALRVAMRIELANLHNDLNATMIYVTHDQVEAMTLADKIVVLQAGEVEQIGSPLELYHHPQNIFVAGFIGSPKMNFVDTVVRKVEAAGITVDLPSGGTARIPVEPGPARVGDKVTLGIRPEHMLEGGSPEAQITGEVMVVERLGGHTFLYIKVGRDLVVTVQAGGESDAGIGDTISIGLPVGEAHLFDQNGHAFRRTQAPAIASRRKESFVRREAEYSARTH